MLTFAFALFWLLCGVAGYGLDLGENQRSYPYSHQGFPPLIVLGLMGLLVVVATSERPYRFALMNFSLQERWFLFQKAYPGLDNDYAYFLRMWGSRREGRTLRRTENRRKEAELAVNLAKAREGKR